MNVSDVCACLQAISDEVASAKEWLIELDTALGDGDLGITMARGFAAVAEQCKSTRDGDIGKLLVESGMAFNRISSSTMGTLISTAFLRGKALMGKTELQNEDIVACLEAGIDGIKTRGKSQRGDKTILDSLEPAVETEGEPFRRQDPVGSVGVGSRPRSKASKEPRTWSRRRAVLAGLGREHRPARSRAGLGVVIWEAVLKCVKAKCR